MLCKIISVKQLHENFRRFGLIPSYAKPSDDSDPQALPQFSYNTINARIEKADTGSIYR